MSTGQFKEKLALEPEVPYKQNVVFNITIHLLLYTTCYVAITWPLATRITTAIPGYAGEVYRYLWNSWLFEKHGRLFGLETDHYFMPLGIKSVLHTSTPLLGLFNLLFENKF